MPQSLSDILIHVIFSTRSRTANLTPQIREELFPYMAATLNNHNCPAIEVGGATDHVHILLRLSRTMTVSQAVEKVKTSSSKWLKPRIPDFAWQAGYGAFSVSRSDAKEVIAYIRGQEEHHRKVSFKEEYLQLLEELGMSYSPEYLWD